MPKVPIALDIELRFPLCGPTAEHRNANAARAAAEAQRAEAERKAVAEAQ